MVTIGLHRVRLATAVLAEVKRNETAMSMLSSGLQRSPLMSTHSISQPTAEITELSAHVTLFHTALNISTVDALIPVLFSALLNSSSVIDALSAGLNLSKDAGRGHTSSNSLDMLLCTSPSA